MSSMKEFRELSALLEIQDDGTLFSGVYNGELFRLARLAPKVLQWHDLMKSIIQEYEKAEMFEK